jgi:hypothetical protein
LNGILLTDMFSRNSAAGMRSIIVTKLEEMNELNRNLGFHIKLITGLSETHPTYGAYVHELDLRRSDFGEYVLSFLGAWPKAGQAAVVDSALTEGDIKKALSLLSDTITLGRSALARSLNCSGPNLQKTLNSLIFRNPPTVPLNRRKQAVLQLFCKEPALNAELAAERLHISRATYYRYRSEAIEDLKELLSAEKMGM